MAGQIRGIIDRIVDEKAGSNKAIAHTLMAKICLKGVLVEKYDSNSEDDPEVIEKLRKIAEDMGVRL